MNEYNLAEADRSNLVNTMLPRRRLLGLIAGLGATALASCGSKSGESAATPASTAGTTAAGATGEPTPSTAAGTESCETVIPEETAGPFPGNGSNGKNLLNQDGVVRRDIRSSFGSSTTTAAGVPLEVRMVVVDVDGCTPIEGAAVYAWHCDKDGGYSMYSSGVESENYLRGVQPSDASGVAAFQSVFPGAYSGRWPHVHFEVYASVADAVGGGTPIATSQIAIPADICNEVYGRPGYETSKANFSGMSLGNDMVFSDDGGVHQLGTMSGTIDSGLAVTLTVPVNA